MSPRSALPVAVALLAVLTEVGSSSSELRRKITEVRTADRSGAAEKPERGVYFRVPQTELAFIIAPVSDESKNSPLCGLKWQAWSRELFRKCVLPSGPGF